MFPAIEDDNSDFMLGAEAQRGEGDDASPPGHDDGARLDSARLIDERYCVSRGHKRAAFDAEAHAVAGQCENIRWALTGVDFLRLHSTAIRHAMIGLIASSRS